MTPLERLKNMRDEHFIRVFNPPNFSVPTTVNLRSALEDFYLSRRAMRRSAATLEHYKYTAGEFISWLESQGIHSPSELCPSHPRAWLVAVSERGVKDTTLHAKARGVRALLRFWYSEGYFISPIAVQMPPLDQKQLPSLPMSCAGS
jgi:site-specific recombinase XerD